MAAEGKNFGSCLAERFFPEHFEDEFVKVLVSVVKSEFAFFQMKVKSVFCQPAKAHKTRLGEGSEAFNAINMRVFIGKFIVAMLHPEVLLIAQVDQAIVAAPAIRVDNTFEFYPTTNYPLERSL